MKTPFCYFVSEKQKSLKKERGLLMESSLVAQNKTYSDPLTSVEKQRCQKVLLRRAHVRPWVPEAPNLSKSSKICHKFPTFDCKWNPSFL